MMVMTWSAFQLWSTLLNNKLSLFVLCVFMKSSEVLSSQTLTRTTLNQNVMSFNSSTRFLCDSGMHVANLKPGCGVWEWWAVEKGMALWLTPQGPLIMYTPLSDWLLLSHKHNSEALIGCQTPCYPSYLGRPLDNFSCYLWGGGRGLIPIFFQ